VKNVGILLSLILILFLASPPVLALSDSMMPSGGENMTFASGNYLDNLTIIGETIPIDSVSTVNSEQFISKIENMTAALYKVAVKVIIPVTIMVIIIGAILAIFFQSARRIVVYAICGLILVFWAPMLVQLVVNWIQM